jgi:SET domain-containing protein
MKKTSAAQKKTSPESSKTTSKKRAKGKTVRVIPKNSPRMGNTKAIVRVSPIHGRGVVARVPLESGARIVEYRGERIDWPEALRRHPHDPEQPFHTFYFSVDDDHVIDGNAGGNFARFMNHSCEPNCEAETDDTPNGTRVYINALRDIPEGEELTYNYGLTLDERHTKTLKKQFACYCGSAKCRGTMLSPKR